MLDHTVPPTCSKRARERTRNAAAIAAAESLINSGALQIDDDPLDVSGNDGYLLLHGVGGPRGLAVNARAWETRANKAARAQVLQIDAATKAPRSQRSFGEEIDGEAAASPASSW